MSGHTCIIIVNWNGHRDTTECLESLARLDETDFRVVVVDNGSTDGSVEAISRWAQGDTPRLTGPVWDRLPPTRGTTVGLEIIYRGTTPRTTDNGMQITLIRAEENLGFAGANNLGMSFARQHWAPSFFWLLNNDTVVTPGALSTLLAYAHVEPSVGMIGSTLTYYQQPDTVQGVGGWLKAERALAGHIGAGLPATALPDASEVEAKLAYVMGASMFVRSTVYERIGGMSEAYFLYFEELDWAMRLPPGIRLGACLNSIIYHKEGQSIGTRSNARSSDTSLYYFTASGLKFFWWHARRHFHIAIARLLWNALYFARKRDFAALWVLAVVVADFATGRRRRGPFGSAEFGSSARATGPVVT